MSTPKPLLVILGQTASGKSELAIKLAKKYNGELINADSRQIYKEMIIGTASPIAYRGLAPKITGANPLSIDKTQHHLFHFVSLSKQYSVAEYKSSALRIIRDVQKRKKLPILVGGTGLYISAIVDNLNIPKAPPNEKLRKQLEKKSAKILFSMLKIVDPKSASIIGPHNKRKLVRSLEVYKLTGKPFSAQQIKGKPLFNVLELGIKIDRDKLYKKIDQRVDEMLKSGLIDETKSLLKKYDSSLSSMSGIGYKEIEQYLSGKLSLEEATQRIKFRTHQYARRQMTWFKRDDRIRWIKNRNEAVKIVNAFIAKYTISK